MQRVQNDTDFGQAISRRDRLDIELHGFRGWSGVWLVITGVLGLLLCAISDQNWRVAYPAGAVILAWWLPYLGKFLRALTQHLLIFLCVTGLVVMGRIILGFTTDEKGCAIKTRESRKKTRFDSMICHLLPAVVTVSLTIAFRHYPNVVMSLAAISMAWVCCGFAMLRHRNDTISV